jgi:hypothetical protein
VEAWLIEIDFQKQPLISHANFGLDARSPRDELSNGVETVTQSTSAEYSLESENEFQ